MASVEAAASLFGSDEVFSDPFAALGTDIVSQTSGDQFFGDRTSDLERIADTESHTSSYSTLPGSNAIAEAHAEWYSTEAPSQSEERQEVIGEASFTTVEQAFPENNNGMVHDPYLPSTGHLATANTSTSRYNDYGIAHPLNDNMLPSQPVASTAFVYTPNGYPSQAPQGASPRYSYADANHGRPDVPNATSIQPKRLSPVSMTVPPPTSTPVVNRPKLPNAYDPPFPTSSKISKRGTRTVSASHPYTYLPHEPSASASGLPGPLPPSLPSSRQTAVRSIPPPGSSNGPTNRYERVSRGDLVNPSHLDSGPESRSAEAAWGHELYSKAAEPPNFQDSGLPQTLQPMLSYQGHQSAGYNTYVAPVQSEDYAQRQESYSQLSPKEAQSWVSSPMYSHGSISISAPVRTTSPAQGASILPPGPPHRSPFSKPHENGTIRTPSPGTVIQSEQGRQMDEIVAYGFAKDGTTPGNTSATIPYQRASPPALVRMNGEHGSPVATRNPYATPDGRSSSPANSRQGPQNMARHLYDPKVSSHGPQRARTVSPGNPSERNRSMSSSSIFSFASQEGPAKHTLPDSDCTLRYSMTKGYEHNHHPVLQNVPSAQETLLKPFHASYVPSPSLLGANDPLGRTAVRVPILSFGFGGKVLTCFHGANLLSTGFDVALSSRTSTTIRVRMLKDIVPQSALDSSAASFLGPLFSDPGTQTTSLVRTGPTSQTKTKKTLVMKYLSERTDELTLGLRYLGPGSLESQRAEGRIILMKILQLMVEHDGRLTGNAELDAGVRTALVPRLEGTLAGDNTTPISGFTAPFDSASYAPGLSSQSYENPISTTTLLASHLDKIQDFLLRGQRKQAYHYALDKKLWAHAMVISSSIDKDAWKEVVNEFLKSELGAQDTSHSMPLMNGREGLRVAYSLFSGQGAAAVQELVPQNTLLKTNRLQPLQVPLQLTPRTPNFVTGGQAASSIPAEAIKQWPETVGMMLSCPPSQDTSAALTSLGDHLVANQLIEAGHICYLLSPQTSLMGGIGHPSARMVLVGSRNPQIWPSFYKDPDPIIFSEIVEFALSLTPPSRGQEPFTGIAHLQAYRFIRAISLAEIGDLQQASRYCEAIGTAANRSSPYVTAALLEQLHGLSERITGIQADKSFWTGTKIGKPSFDTIGGWLEGRFTKLVTGDAEMDKSHEIPIKPDHKEFSGPFSHYSSISSTSPSARSSPQPSITNYNVLPPARTGSAMAYSSPNPVPQIDRASSAIDHTRRESSPVLHIISQNMSTTKGPSSPSIRNTHSAPYLSQDGDSPVTARPPLISDTHDQIGQEATWWGSNVYDEGNAVRTPTAAKFLHVDENSVPESSDGFISLMDNAPYSVDLQPSFGNNFGDSQMDDEEDLGFGNSKPKPKTRSEETVKSPSTTEPAKDIPEEQPGPKAAPATGGWFSRWWKKSDGPGPIRANLGNESDFYFDKDLGRWVNRKAKGEESSKPTVPPPPPSRAQTASPGMTSRPPGASESTMPPTRPASAIDLSTSPPSRTVMRVRSNLIPTPESAPSTPTGTRQPPSAPPPSRPRSQASKRNVRSRYVNVFQEGNNA